jgi:type I restriction enzyme S subunit
MQLGDLLEALIDHRGKTPKKLGGTGFVDHGVPVVSAINIKGGRVVLDSPPRCVTEQIYQRWMPAPLREGDVLLTSEAPLGEVARVPSDEPLVLGQRLFGLRGRDGVLDNGFLYYLLQWRPIRDQLASRSSGTTVTGIRQSELVRVSIELPSLAQQEATADILTTLDNKINGNEKIASLALQTAEARYRAETAETERVVALKDAGKWLSGGTPSTAEPLYWGGKTPWISSSSLKSFYLASSQRRVTDLGIGNGTRVVPSGTVLFIVRGMSLKTEFRVGVAQCPLAFGQDTKALIPHREVGSTTLGVALYSMRSDVLSLVDEAGHGTGRLSTDRIEQLQVLLPTKERAAQAESGLSSVISRGASAAAEGLSLVTLRDALLPRLMTGEVRVRDAEALVGAAV